jgi:hypothetical protein
MGKLPRQGKQTILFRRFVIEQEKSFITLISGASFDATGKFCIIHLFDFPPMLSHIEVAQSRGGAGSGTRFLYQKKFGGEDERQ